MISEKYASILRVGYPEIHFVPEDVKQSAFVPEDGQGVYATYYIGLFAPWDDRNLQVTDWRIVGLQAHAAYILGVDAVESRPRLLSSKNRPPEKGKYVCIATQATAQCKYWNNASGWMDVIAWLNKKGYRVLCIDRDRTTVNGIYGNHIPYGVEDYTGDLPLQQRVDLIAGAELFIGLPSGLAWLAWGTGKPVVLIAGFTEPGTEFYTPYRVQQFHTCHGCGNDMRHEHKYDDFGACPHHRGTDREFECTRFITAEYVERIVEKALEEK